MSTEKENQLAAVPEFELAVSSGGSTSVLAGAGTVAACALAGIYKFRRIYGVSGGAIFGSIAATGMSAREVLRLTIATDFSKNVSLEDGVYKGVKESLQKSWCRTGKVGELNGPLDPELVEWHSSGILGSQKIGEFVKKESEKAGITGWPEPFCTMATRKDGSQVVFNKDGVFLCEPGGSCQQLDDKPAPLDVAVRGSATIPGIIASIEYKGMRLYDGGLSRDGLCPVGLFIRHFDANPRKIIACRVGEDNLKPVSGRIHRFARWVWQVHTDFHWGPETAGVIEFRPEIEHVHTLKFNLSRDEKWLAILIAFEAAAAKLALEGVLAGDSLFRAQNIFKELGYWRDYVPAVYGSPEQPLAERAEAIFTEQGLW